MKINEMIRTRRKEMNLTQEQVASRLGVSAPAVHKWETGSSYPDITLLPALARLLGTDLNTRLPASVIQRRCRTIPGTHRRTVRTGFSQ